MTRTGHLALGVVTLILALAGPVGAGPFDAPGFAKAYTCSACHGAGGNSQADTMPILAGMNPAYFKKAIEDYASGKRPSPEMEPFAKQVKALGVDEIAGYFAAQSRQPASARPTAAAVERGRAASAQCAGCHGANGAGDPAKVVPAIAGQPPGYLRNQMALFKADRRSPGDEALGKMKAVMKTLSDETIADLAAFFSSLR
jgi:cytochrome c553